MCLCVSMQREVLLENMYLAIDYQEKKIPLFACLHMGDNYEVTKLTAIDWVICHFKTSFTLRS